MSTNCIVEGLKKCTTTTTNPVFMRVREVLKYISTMRKINVMRIVHRFRRYIMQYQKKYWHIAQTRYQSTTTQQTKDQRFFWSIYAHRPRGRKPTGKVYPPGGRGRGWGLHGSHMPVRKFYKKMNTTQTENRKRFSFSLEGI